MNLSHYKSLRGNSAEQEVCSNFENPVKNTSFLLVFNYSFLTVLFHFKTLLTLNLGFILVNCVLLIYFVFIILGLNDMLYILFIRAYVILRCPELCLIYTLKCWSLKNSTPIIIKNWLWILNSALPFFSWIWGNYSPHVICSAQSRVLRLIAWLSLSWLPLKGGASLDLWEINALIYPLVSICLLSL